MGGRDGQVHHQLDPGVGDPHVLRSPGVTDPELFGPGGRDRRKQVADDVHPQVREPGEVA